MTQIKKKTLKMYSCSQAVLYAGLDIVWDSQAENEVAFFEENTKYTPGLAATKKAEIQAVRALPDGRARKVDREMFRNRLVEVHGEVIGLWNSLEGYIKRAFKVADYKPRVDEAGKGYYAKAFLMNWEDVTMLLQSAKNFLDAHGAVLASDGGMPASFVVKFMEKRDEFMAIYGEFKDAQQDNRLLTDEKIEANNAIYKESRRMMEDGKHIFRRNASLRNRFVWKRILELVSPKSPSPALPQGKGEDEG